MRPFVVFFITLLIPFTSFSQIRAPINSGTLLLQADQFYDSGEYKKALSLYDQIDRNDTNYVKSLYGKAICYEADSQFSKGISVCEEAIKRHDHREMLPSIYNSYGNLYNRLGDPEKSISVFDDAISKYPAFTILYFNKGVVLFGHERYAEAEAVFKQTLLINPYQYSAHFFLGLCALQQGKIIPALLSFAGYLLISPEGKYSKRCVSILDAISRGKDEIQEYKAKRKEEGDENFTLVEEILLSKIALEKEYKLQVSFDDVIFRQIQVVLEKLEYKEDDPDFWMQYYVPYYTKFFKDGQFELFIFWAFENIQIKEIQDFNKKNKKAIENFTTTTARYFNEIRSTRTLAYNKRAGLTNKYLYSDGKLQGKGELVNEGKDYTGVWTFYYPEGNLKAAGQFELSEKQGPWKFYFFSGKLKSLESYSKGKADGRQLYYSETGLITYDENYVNGQKNGFQTEYYINGQVYSTAEYKMGRQNGEYREYYNGGNLHLVKHFDNDVASGAFVYYYQNGNLKETGTYQNGKLEGPYKEYHENGKLSDEGQFKNGMAEGEWTSYHENGKLKYKSQVSNNKLEGNLQEYDDEGRLKATYAHKKGNLNGEYISNDKDGKVFARFQFSDDKLKSAIYYNKDGKEISKSEYKNGILELDIYMPDGTKSTHRVFNDKGNQNGTETAFYPSGKISSTTEFENGEKNGTSTEYYINGKKKSVTPFKNGKQDGLFTAYYSTGKIQSEGWFAAGQQQGMWKYYDEMGNQSSQNYFLNDELNGYLTEYFPNGNKSLEKKISHGLLEELEQYDSTGKMLIHDSFPQFNGKYRLVFPDGHQKLECNYVKGAFNGRLTQYYFDGAVESIQYYKYGLLDSSYVSYQYPHVKSTEGQYFGGKKTGQWKSYDAEGHLLYAESFENGELDGLKIRYLANNKITSEIHYKNGERNGLATYTDPGGSLICTIRYEDGLVAGYSYMGKDGKMVPEIKAEHGNLAVNAFFQNGQPSRKCNFSEGRIDGADIFYFSTGQINVQDSTDHGIDEGTYRAYYPNGKLSKMYYYHLDNVNGAGSDYNDKGVITDECYFYNGQKNGEERFYSDNGQLRETRYYYYNELLSVKK